MIMSLFFLKLGDNKASVTELLFFNKFFCVLGLPTPIWVDSSSKPDGKDLIAKQAADKVLAVSLASKILNLIFFQIIVGFPTNGITRQLGSKCIIGN
jgi:hypothetical protein